MTKFGKLTLILGTMFAGKTEELISQYKIKKTISKAQTFYFKPSVDTRDKKDIISTHNGNTQEVIMINKNNDKEILEIIQNKVNGKKLFIFIDEVQFFNSTIVVIIKKLIQLGCYVFIGGLRNDYLGKPFETISSLIAIADDVMIKKAVCTYELPDGTICGEPAIFSQMYGKNKQPIISEFEGQIHIGASEKYETRCREHFIDQDLLFKI